MSNLNINFSDLRLSPPKRIKGIDGEPLDWGDGWWQSTRGGHYYLFNVNGAGPFERSEAEFFIPNNGTRSVPNS